MVGSEQVRAEDRLPIVNSKIIKQSQRRGAGRVDDEVDLPELTSSFTGEPLTIFHPPNVADDRSTAGELSQPIGSTSAYDDGSAEVAPQLRNGAPDARRGADDNEPDALH
jgi:hypothetical protein